jgi:hypothetical protein
MRRGLRGYDVGGAPGGASLVRLGRRPEESEFPGRSGRRGNNISQNNQFIFAAPTTPKTQTQVAARTGFELRRTQRLGI